MRELHEAGRPVLVGTSNVEASEALSARLSEAGLAHQLLNARQDADEAALVARAGEAGRITVATRMAGRGTDIPLGPGVEAAGGLAVVATELSEAGRIDRQLFGRCARQGTPGSFEQWVSLEDRLARSHLPGGLLRLLAGERLPGRLRFAFTKWAQIAEEKRSARARSRLLSSERATEDLLAFTGRTDR